MAIAPTSTASAAAAAAPKGLFGTSGGDFNMFLKLLTTQMQNQDPLNPMDTAQYTQQLVQYSQVEQSIAQTGVLRDILGRLSNDDLSQASNLIGREVRVESNLAGLSAVPAEWAYSLSRNASQVVATIRDESGRTVGTRTLDPSDRSGTFVWDGTLPDGRQAAHGAYSLEIKATEGSTTIPVSIQTAGVVKEVTSAGGSLSVGINGLQLPASKITRVTG